MDTLTRPSTCRHAQVRVATDKSTEFIDVTEQVEALVAATGLLSGLVNIQTLHTTTAVVVNEHEPLLLADFASLLESTVPLEAIYKHDDVGLRAANVVLGERPNGHSHCRALLLNTSVCLNVAGGRLQLGRWQRVFFVEFDGPRTRELSIVVMGEGGR